VKILMSCILLTAGVAMCTPINVIGGEKSAGISTETLHAGSAKTATSLSGIKLDDTTEDPASAKAGEELVKKTTGSVIGRAAPLAKMKTIDGGSIDLAEIYGKKPVYLKFWATWCTPCRQQMPGFEKAYKALGDKMQFIAVDIGYSDDEASVRGIKDIYGLTMPIVIDDGRLAKLFHMNVTPQHVLIGKDARFAYMGHAENAALEHAIQHAVAEVDGKAVATATDVDLEKVVRPGDVVHKMSLTALDGKNIPLKARPGHLLAVQFFSSWCEWYLETSRPGTSKACARVRKKIEEMSATIPTVDWVGVSGGPWATKEDLLDYKKNNNVNIPLGLDKSNTLFRTFGIRDIPTIALINDSGRLVRLIGPNVTGLTGVVRAALVGEHDTK
jgi:thiol-disulfide isomerase/thioredoxin